MAVDALAIEGMMMQGFMTVRGRGWLAAAAPLQSRRALAARPPARGGGES